jgi:acyl-CoA hydrolase
LWTNPGAPSRILPHFNGDFVTDPRSQAYYIVTEYGVVNLAGRSTWERAEMLISIAHPRFREELIAQAEKQKIWRRSNRRSG